MYVEGFADAQPGQSHQLLVEGLEPGSYTLYAQDYATNQLSLSLELGAAENP